MQTSDKVFGWRDQPTPSGSEFAGWFFLKESESPSPWGKQRHASDLFVREGYQMDYVFDWTIKRIHESMQGDTHAQEVHHTCTKVNCEVELEKGILAATISTYLRLLRATHCCPPGSKMMDIV